MLKRVFSLFLFFSFSTLFVFSVKGQAGPECFSDFTGALPDEDVIGDCSGSCYETIKYLPTDFLETPVRIVKVMLHVVQKNDGSDNFQDNPTDRLFLQNVFTEINNHFASLKVMTADGSTPLIPYIDTRIQFQIEDIRFYQNSYYWHSANASEGAKAEMYDQFVLGTPNTDPDIIHVFITGCRLGPGQVPVYIIGGVSFLPTFAEPTIMETAWYHSYEISGYNTDPSNEIVLNMAHELCHGMGLVHAYLNGNIMDTGSPTSHWGWALTLGQVALMNYWLENPNDGNSGITYKAVGTDYRTKDESHDIVIHNGESVEWCLDKKLNTDIIIETGGELIIKCEMGMATDAFIYVERGARLILDGAKAKITHNKTKWFALDPNSVEDRWQGIFVEGNASVPQSVAMRQNGYVQAPDDPGIVLLKNGATLEYAYMAVFGQSNKPWPQAQDYWGGFVYAENARFINNRWGIQFMKYDRPSYSAFVNCEFRADPEAEPAIAVKNWGETNILVKNCLFDGVAGGVLTFDGQMNVLNCRFKNITIPEGRGVWAGGTGPLLSSCTVIGNPGPYVNDFYNVDVGVYFSGANVNIIDNKFINNSIDIVGEGLSTFYIKENIMQNGIGGVDLRSTGPFGNNRVNCNQILNKSVGMAISGKNQGLKFDGNIFGINWSDVSLYAAANGDFAAIPPQGDLSKPAMNQFTNKNIGDYHFYGNIMTKPGGDQNISFTYYYPISPDPATIRTKPICSSNDPCTYNGTIVWQNFETYGTNITLDENVCQGDGPVLAPELAFWEKVEEELLSGNYAGADQLLVNRGTKPAREARIGLRIKQGDLPSAQMLLDAYAAESGADDQFVKIQQINIDRLDSGTSYYLSSENRDFLVDVALSEGRNSGYAASLMYLLEGISFEHLPKATNGDSGGTRSGNSKAVKKVAVSPNPTAGIVRLDWSEFELSGKRGQVVIRDRMGLVAMRFDIVPGEDWKDIDMSGFGDGTYFYYLLADGKELDAGQIVLSKN